MSDQENRPPRAYPPLSAAVSHGQSQPHVHHGQQGTAPQAPSHQQQQHYASQYPTGPHLASQKPPPPHAQMQRSPSYQAGDDTGYFDPRAAAPVAAGGGAGSAYPYHDGRGGSLHGSHSSNFGSRHSQHSTVSQTSSHGSSAMSGYQHQYQGPNTPSPGQQQQQPPSYNPQQFSQQQQPPPTPQQAGYNPQVFSQFSSQPPHHQPYNPAAYQSSPSVGSFQSSPAGNWSTGTPVQTSYPSTSPSFFPPSHAVPTSPGPMSARPLDTYNDYSLPYGNNTAHHHPTYPPMPSQSVAATPVSAHPSSYSSYNYPPSNHSQSTVSYGTEATNDRIRRYSSAKPPAQTSDYQYMPNPLAHSSVHHDAGYRTATRHVSYPASPPPPPPPAHQNPQSTSPRRTDTLTRHPQARPLPGPPTESEGRNSREQVEPSYDDIIKQVEAAVMEGRPDTTRRHSSRARRPLPQQPPIQESDNGAYPTSAVSPGVQLLPDEVQTHTNGGNISSTGTGQYVNYNAYSDDSDAEVAAGLEALRVADEEEAAMRARRNTHTSTTSSFGYQHQEPPPPPPPQNQQHHGESSSDSDFALHDIGLYGGGYSADMHYGEDALMHGVRASSQPDGRGSTPNQYDYPSINQDSIHPFPGIEPTARVDTVGTGGLSEPSAYRRMSFENGDEAALRRPSSATSSLSDLPGEGEPQDLFFHPGMSSRPLPPPPVPVTTQNLLPHLMPAGTYRSSEHTGQIPLDHYHMPPYPTSPDTYSYSNSTSAVPRSTSLSDHTNTHKSADAIIRSKTDADRVKSKQAAYDSSLSTPSVTLDLPVLPAGKRKKFHPGKLSSEQFRKCTEPWAISAIVAWIRDLAEDEADLKEHSIVDAIVALLTHKVPTMNTADAETLSDRVVKSMFAAGALIKDEEWVKFGPGTLSGVLWQITGQGCYSSRLHNQEYDIFGRCYSHHCMRTLKKINLKMVEAQKKAEDWATFYKIGKEVFSNHSKKEIDRQNNLHEIVTTEDSYIAQLDVLRTLYRDTLATAQPSVINPKRLDRFLRDVFGKVDAVKRVNEEYLLAQLKYRQKEQGPFIVGFSDIFREWIRKAKAAYIEYAATFPNANYLVRREAESNMLFRSFLNQARENRLSNRLSWDTYLKAPITRIQRYTLLLNTVYKNMEKDSEEKSNLLQAIEEIKLVALDCDNKVGEMTKKMDLKELGAKLQLRPEMKSIVELNLEHLGREIIYQGDLQRPRTKRFNWVDIRAILFDHYLVLAKIVIHRDAAGIKHEMFDVSKLPIPMDLLTLVSTNDDPVVRSAVKGIAPANPRTGAPTGLAHAATAPQITSPTPGAAGRSVTTTVLENSRDEKILYPFRIKHLGKRDVYVLYAPTAQSRQEWCEKIYEAKTKHAAALYAQNAEPFRLRVLSDSAFAYSDQAVPPKSAVIKGTPLDRAIREVEKKYERNLSRPLPVCRAAVNCATVFQQPPGKMMCAIGTDYGVYISAYDDPRGWTKGISMLRVTQVAVFEEFNLFLLISDKSLIGYHLDSICPVNGTVQPDSQRRAPQKLSGNREVGFFAAGRMKDRALVFYKKRDGISSTFKVLEPVLQKSSSSRSRFLSRRGQTEFFREYDEFYIPAESYGINLFHTSLAIATSRGVEVLTLDKKQPWSVPNLKSEQADVQSHLTSIANRVKDLRPLGMFRLSDSEFLVAFQECAVYVNKHGDVSRSVVMEFVGIAHAACLCGKFLLLFNEDFVEVRNALNGRLRQVIAGRNVTLLDDGGNGNSGIDQHTNAVGGSNFNEAASTPTGSGRNGLGISTGFGTISRTVKICMQHPERERSQIVLELLENEGQKD
ncbi:Dbl like protein (DH) domain [Trichophyton rubrum]|nr:Dbl like protein (DH) domain [Trichophyton rubrum]